MPFSYKYSSRFDAIKSIIQPRSRIRRSNHIAEIPRPFKTDRSPTRCFDKNDRTDNSTNNESIERKKSAVVAFFNDCSSTALPSSLPFQEAKSVRFRADIDVMEVERFNDDSGNIWYSKTDFFAIERENLKISWQRRNDEELKDDEKQTVRGLELEVYPSTARRRQETEDLAFESVMVEQDNQDRQGICDPYAIAEAYKKNGARQCQLEAQAVGLKDFENVRMDHEQIRKLKTLPKCNDFSESAYRYHSNETGDIAQ